eukprot:SAG31_NODE_35209_length_325_cov_0.898230_1_plen_29_part_10
MCLKISANHGQKTTGNPCGETSMEFVKFT